MPDTNKTKQNEKQLTKEKPSAEVKPEKTELLRRSDEDVRAATSILLEEVVVNTLETNGRQCVHEDREPEGESSVNLRTKIFSRQNTALSLQASRQRECRETGWKRGLRRFTLHNGKGGT